MGHRLAGFSGCQRRYSLKIAQSRRLLQSEIAYSLLYPCQSVQSVFYFSSLCPLRGFFCVSVSQYALLSRPTIVCTIVRMMILISSASDQFSMYQRSYLVRSTIEVSPRIPLTCAQPVMPAFSR
jgi:hypothetical protein